MQRPEVIFATTGTTSSGKSTLVNFLCGSEIMPVAVGEKSAGLVTIHHSQHRKMTIHSTDGATWPTGQWPRPGEGELTDEAIRQVLDLVMSEYNKLRDKPGEPACPLIDLDYPTRLGNDPALLDLPAGCQFRILDLPGLKYVGDEGNSKVIRLACREALCLVLYDSAEVDPQKKRILLEQVADQVKELGGSPARMLFVLNRIDAFGQNLGGKEEEEEFVRDTERAIRKILNDKLPEHTDYINLLRPVRLSAKPGLLALVAQTHTGTEQLQALQGIDDSFRRLIPATVRDELLGNVRKWKPSQIQAVTEGVMRNSHCLTFQERLRSHVQERLPELVIPQAVDRLRGQAAFDAASWADILIQAELNSSAERYQAECDRLAQARSDLTQLRDESSRLLRTLFERMRAATTNDEWTKIVWEMGKTRPYNELPKNTLEPLFRWREALANVVGKCLACVQDALTNGYSLKQSKYVSIIDQLPKDPRRALMEACDALRRVGYEGDIARNGGRRIAANTAELEALQRTHYALKTLGKCLAAALSELVYHTQQNELERVYDALDRLFEHHRKHVEKSAQELMQERKLKLVPDMPQEVLKRFQTKWTVNRYDIEAGLDIVHTQKQVQQGTERYQSGARSETWDEAVTAERTSSGFWGWLKGLGKGTIRWVTRSRTVPIFDERPRYVLREYDETTLPAITTLLKSWEEETNRLDPKLLGEFGIWFLGQADMVCNAITDFQTNLLKKYQHELDAAHAEAKNTSDTEQRKWTDAQSKLQAFRDSFGCLASLHARG